MIELSGVKLRSPIKGSFKGADGGMVNYQQLQVETIDQESGRIEIIAVSVPSNQYDRIHEYQKLQNKHVTIPVTVTTSNGKTKYRMAAPPIEK